MTVGRPDELELNPASSTIRPATESREFAPKLTNPRLAFGRGRAIVPGGFRMPYSFAKEGERLNADNSIAPPLALISPSTMTFAAESLTEPLGEAVRVVFSAMVMLPSGFTTSIEPKCSSSKRSGLNVRDERKDDGSGVGSLLVERTNSGMSVCVF